MLLSKASDTNISEQTINAYLTEKDHTQTVKLEKTIPVELRYETIVAEDGKLHIYKDVYDQDSNTEENLRAVLEANGVKMEDLTEAERTQVMDALNAMASKPQANLPTAAKPASTATSAADSSTNKSAKSAIAKVEKPAEKAKPITKNQKEVVIEIAALKGKGYPVAVNFDTGAGKPPALVAKKD